MRPVLAILLLCMMPVWLSAAEIDTVAGSGEKGYSGDGGPALKATLNQPFHCELAGQTLYIAEDKNHCVRALDLTTGILTTVAGCGKKGDSGDGGTATRATFNECYAVVKVAGDLYIVDRLNARIRKVTLETGIITTVAGVGKKGYSGDDGPGNKAGLVEPNDCFPDGKGGLLIADVGDWRIRRLDLQSGVITTFAGTGRFKGKPKERPKDKGDGGPAVKAIIEGARAVCVDGKGNTYICEREGHSIRKVDEKGTITTLAGTGERGALDGPGKKAKFNGPKAIRCDAAGNVYVVDTENQSIRKIDAKTGEVTTVVGGRRGPEGDGGDPLKAGMGRPHGCVLDGKGVLYIADSENYRVRRVRP